MSEQDIDKLVADGYQLIRRTRSVGNLKNNYGIEMRSKQHPDWEVVHETRFMVKNNKKYHEMLTDPKTIAPFRHG